MAIHLIGVASGQAAERTFQFEAVLTSVDAAAATAFSPGDAVTGSFTFTEAPNQPTGNYFDVITLFDVTIDGLTWNKSSPCVGCGNIFIRDDVCCTRDGYLIGVTLDGPTVLGDVGQTLTPASFSFDLYDNDATIFSSTALPLTPPDPVELEDQTLIMRFDDPAHASDAVLTATLTSLYLFVDCDNNGIADEQQQFGYLIDDNSCGGYAWGQSGQSIIWMNHFTVAPDGEVVDTIEIVWSTFEPIGTMDSLLIYDDPNNDGDPNDAVLLTSIQASSNGVECAPGAPDNAGIIAAIPIPPTFVGYPGDSFFVAAHSPLDSGNGNNPAIMDSSGHMTNSWWIASPVGASDLVNISNNTVVLRVDSLGLGGAWRLRAVGRGIDSVPSACRELGDSDGDGLINISDLLSVIAQWGSCAGCREDANNDGEVDILDLLNTLANWS